MRIQSRCLQLLMLSCTSLSAIAATAQTAAAQADRPNESREVPPGEIVVTATRREQTLSTVPLSVLAVDQAALDKQGVRSTDDLMRFTPSITFGQSSGFYGTGQSNISIRGVQSTSGIPTVGVYIDDTPIQTRTGVSPSLTNAYPILFDLDRVEVLRGPQGTLFGTASLGGAVRFITPEPVMDGARIYARTELATTYRGGISYEAGLAGGAALVDDTVGFRASVYHRHDAGYIDRLGRVSREVVEKDINSSDSYAVRLALGWKPTENITLTPSLFYQELDIKDSSLVDINSSDVGRNDFRNGLFSRPESRKDRFFLPAFKAVVEFDGFSLISNTSYITRKARTASDDDTLNLAIFADYYDPAPPPGFDTNFAFTNNRTTQKGFEQEIRLQNTNDGPFNWVVGGFFSRSVVTDNFGGANTRLLDTINYAVVQGGGPPFGSVAEIFGVEPYQGIFVVFQDSRYLDIQKSVFAQVDYEFVPRLTVTAGLRYTDATFNLDNFVAGPLYASDGIDVSLKTKNKPLTPKFGLSFQADRNNLFYVNASKGVRGGGVAEAAGIRCINDGIAIGFDPMVLRRISPDSLWTYEVGSKNTLAGGRLSIDASAYHTDWTNLQSTLTLPECQVHTVFNFGSAKIDGLDLALSARPVDGLTLTASASYINARYSSELKNAGGEVIRRKGEPLDVAPWSIHLSGQYDFPVGASDAYLRGDFTYSSHDDTPLDVTSPLVDPGIPRAPSSSQLDLRAGVRFDEIEVSLFATNVLNAHPFLGQVHSTLADPNLRSVTFRPRTIGLTATMRR